MMKHSDWRKLAKKVRRQRIRQQQAGEKHKKEGGERHRKQLSPTYIKWVDEQTRIEKFEVEEELRLAKEANERWLKIEEEAQEQWQELQKKFEQTKNERIRQNELIKAEWEKEQKRLKKIEKKKLKEIDEYHQQQTLLKEQIEYYIDYGGEVPEQLKKPYETNPNKEICPFFKKTGVCRFGDTCSRNHIRPAISCILLIPNFYSHISLEHFTENEYGSDNLEFETYETYAHFKEFFYDVLPEFEKFGHIKQFKVCCNQETHLRGNVYVEYSNCREAIKSYRVFQGRWYGGRRLNLEFCEIKSWKSAICGLFFKKMCPKGTSCNFLHAFQNPGNLFYHADKDLHRIPPSQNESESASRNWRWSESPERPTINHYSEDDKSKKNKLKIRSRENGKNYDHKSRERKKNHSRSISSRKQRERSHSKSERSKREVFHICHRIL